MENSLVEEKVSPLGYRIRVDLNTYNYYVTSPRGKKSPDSPPPKVPRLVFLGDDFNLTHFFLGELVFVNAKDGKMIIPYQFGGSRELKTVLIPTKVDCDIMPLVIYHYMHYKEIVKATNLGYEFKHIVVDESISKGDMVNLKVRYPKVNIYIQKKKNPNTGK